MAALLDPFAPRTPHEGVTSFERHLAGHRHWAEGHPASPAALRRALTFWTRLHGVLALELAGHFGGMDFDPALLFADEAANL